MRTWILMCGGRKCPQNSKVGAESAPKMSKWGQKAPPQFGHDKIRMKVCTSQQKVDTTLYFYTSFNEHNTPYTVLESDNSESMPDVLH